MFKQIYRNLAHKYFKNTAGLSKGWTLSYSKKLNLTLLLNLNNYIDFIIFKKGWFEKHVIENIRYYLSQKEIALFVDVGSNIGQMSLYVAKNFPHVQIISYEAVRWNFMQQQASMLINNLSYDLNNLAVSDSEQPIKMFLPKHQANLDLGKFNPGMASLVLDEYRDESKGIEVASIVLGPVMEARIPGLNGNFVFFKIDVEGAEMMVLNGLTSFLNAYNKIIIIIEFLFERDAPTYLAAKDLLVSMGFKMFDKNRNLIGTWATHLAKNDDFIFIKE